MNNTVFKSISKLAAIALLTLLPASVSFAKTSLLVTGVKGELKENIELLVGAPPALDEVRKYRRFVAGLPAQSAIALNALGYYAADIKVSDNTVNGDTVVTVQVTPNDPVRVESLNITLLGDANDDPAYTQILSKLSIKKGDIFVSGQYEAAKAALQDQAQDLGYFQFEFSESAVSVSRRKLTADITLTADSGPRYTFGDIIFEQNIFRRSFLERWLPFATGAPYESGLIGELTQNLQSSGYFKSVRVSPQQDRRYGTQVPVRVDLQTRDRNEIGVGVGYVTDLGPRTKMTWDKPLINRRGHSIATQLGISKNQQNASFAYRIPRRNEPLYNYWGIEYGLRNETDGDTKSFLSTLNFQRVSRTSSQWIESLFLRWEHEVFTAGIDEKTTDLILPGVNYQRSHSKGSPFPTWGQSISLQLLGGSKEVLSSIDILKFTARFRYLRAISDRNTLIGTVQYGIIQSNDYDRVPVSHRFFAGGDRSVRGFRYKDISPRAPKVEGEEVGGGEAVGGRFLEVASIEYNYRFLDLWSFAVFADAGRAYNNGNSDNFNDKEYSVGAGIGLRWQSPVGPFQIDLATPVETPYDAKGVRVHLSLGAEL